MVETTWSGPAAGLEDGVAAPSEEFYQDRPSEDGAFDSFSSHIMPLRPQELDHGAFRGFHAVLGVRECHVVHDHQHLT